MLIQDSKLSPSIINLKDLLDESLSQSGTLDPTEVLEIVEGAGITEQDLMPFADFDHPVQDGYGRKMMIDAGKFEIMAMSWAVGDFSSVHNHGHTQWGVVQVFGNAQHYMYEESGGEIGFAKQEILPHGATTMVTNATIHQMGNPSTDRFLTLHVYGCNDRDGDITADARNYEFEFDRINHTTGGAFFNLPADQIYDFLDCPSPTAEVMINYARLLLQYYERLPQSPEINDLKKNLIHRLEQRLCG